MKEKEASLLTADVIDPWNQAGPGSQKDAHQQHVSETWCLAVSNHSVPVSWVLDVATIISLDG